MDQIVALVAFSAVSSGTPGPNNLLLWASGAEFGLRRSIPHVLGTAIGIGGMALAVAAGLGAAITAVPGLAVLMKVGGSIYLLYLAWQVAGAGALREGTLARPMSLLQAAAFQVINPKAWVFALGAITTFRPSSLPIETGSLLVAVVMMIVILPTAGLWSAGGGAIGRLLVNDRRRRIVSLALAAVIALTVVSVWI